MSTATDPTSVFVDVLPQEFRTTTVNMWLVESAMTTVEDAQRSADVWLDDAVIQMKELLLLEEGWDGEGAPAISPFFVDLGRQLLSTLVSQVPRISRPFIAPTIAGGIALEWHRDDAHFEIVLEDGDGCHAFAVSGGHEWESPLDAVTDDAMRVLLVEFVEQ